jgi:hypothetical protein
LAEIVRVVGKVSLERLRGGGEGEREGEREGVSEGVARQEGVARG